MTRSFARVAGKQRVGPSTRRRLRALLLGSAVLAGVLVALTTTPAQVIHRDSFETGKLAWSKGAADAAFKENLHEITDQTAHLGQNSEHIQLTSEVGNYVYYTYPLGRAPLVEELNISVWLKANRPGAQVMARLVLPHERKADNISEPLSVMLRGDTYKLVGRWERLELRTPTKLAKEQQQLLRLELKRDVDFTDAYIDMLILNLYSGPGFTEVWLDDLEAGPITDEVTTQPASGDPAAGALTSTTRPARPARNAVVELNQDHLQISNKRIFFRAIRHTDVPLKTLRDAGFNCVILDPSTTPAEIDEAIGLGFWLVPTLPLNTGSTPTATGESLGRDVSRFLQGDAVLFWYLGGGRALEDAPLIASAAQTIRAIDPGRPIGADIWDGFWPYARSLDLVGTHRWPLMTNLELPQYREWLNQRRLLAQPRSSFQWTWVQTHLPDWFTTQAYDRKLDVAGKPGGADDIPEPIGPQPEQIRLLTYTALAAGCQGIAYWSDRFLADSHQGRDRLLTLALLNQELQMLEPMLLTAIEAPTWVATSHKDVQAAIMRTEKGILVMPMWLGMGAQFVPGQSATVKLTITIPEVPGGTQAWEITPGDVHALPIDRVVGGVKVIVPEFGLTSAIVFTSDNTPTGLLVRFQDHAQRTRKLAAQWAHDLAEATIDKVVRIEAELERSGHTLPDAKALQDDARTRLNKARDFWNSADYRQAYQESQRALRPLRILMRAQWDKAVKGLDSPVASPYAVSYYTLPRHWEFIEQAQHAQVGLNVLPNGGFEADPNQTATNWQPQQVTVDELDLSAAYVGTEFDEPGGGVAPSKNGPAPIDAGILIPVAGVQPGSTARPANPAQSPKSSPDKPDKIEPRRHVRVEPKEGQRCAKLQIKAKNGTPAPAALERTFLAINSPAVHLPPGSLVRVSAWVRIPQTITASVDGALFYDSAGGEPLAIRLTGVGDWKRYQLYRRVPASGTISVTLALTGIGTAYFDDVRIEPLTPDRPAAQPNNAWRHQDAAAPAGQKP